MPQKIKRFKVNGEIYPSIGLALGSGATKAVCQFGLIKRFREHNIPVSHIAGSSMGAIVAGVYALGLDIGFALEKAMGFAQSTSINNISNFNISKESIYKKDYTEGLLKEIFADFTFEECKTPLTVTSVDLESGKVVLLDKGLLVPSIRASTSIPGVFEPSFLNNHYLVDGGLLEDCPVQTLREVGDFDIVIGSHIQDLSVKQKISGHIFNKFYRKRNWFQKFYGKVADFKQDMQIFSNIMFRTLDIVRDDVWKYRLKEANPELLINIDIQNVSMFDVEKTKELVEIGEKAFDKHFYKLMEIIELKKKELNK